MSTSRKAYREFHRNHSYFSAEWEAFDANFKACALPPSFAALDVGCGSGAYSSERIAGFGGTVMAIDVDLDSVDKARERLASPARGDESIRDTVGSINIGHANAEVMDYEDASFDIVVSRGGLRHCVNWERAFGECMRVLKPGPLNSACLSPSSRSGSPLTTRKEGMSIIGSIPA